MAVPVQERMTNLLFFCAFFFFVHLDFVVWAIGTTKFVVCVSESRSEGVCEGVSEGVKE